MNILLFSTRFAEYMIEMANALSEENDITLCIPDTLISDKHKTLLKTNVNLKTFHYVDYRSIRKKVAMFKSILSIINGTSPEVIHIQYFGFPQFWLLLPFLKGSKLVNTVHDPKPHSGDLLSPEFRWNTRLVNKFSTKIIVHGDSLKKEVVKYQKVSPSKIDVIPHGHLGIFKEWRKKPVEKVSNTFLFFGRIWPYKGLNYFIEAANKVGEIAPNTQFIIAGKGEDINRYITRIKHKNQFKIINKKISEIEIDSLFQAANSVVLPYTDASQSGVIPIAIPYRCLVIASKVGALPEIIEDNITGLLTIPKNSDDLAEKMFWVIQNNDEVNILKKNAEKLLDTKLSWTVIAKQLIDTYKK